MSNDISDMNKVMKMPSRSKIPNSTGACRNCASDMPSSEQSENKETMVNSMDCLGAMGCAQVNMNNPLTKGVKASVETFLEDPEYVQEHNEMCDNLVRQGYPLEEAIGVTDRIFDSLKTEDTYK